ncbi:MAG: formylglycine-generating enzyme family protein [Alloprevotella sp.]|nr:formylglycine-generating enzyme family protein [Alloprevotella sp.]
MIKKCISFGISVLLYCSLVVLTGCNNSSKKNKEPDDKVLTITVNGVSFNMVKVDGGTFMMGATPDQEDVSVWETPAHKITLSTFYIGQYEVTQALWEAVMGTTPTQYGEQWSFTYGLGDDYPAYNLSYTDIQTFIARLSNMTGYKFRMPTEAEWEFAARGGNMSSGYKYSGSDTLDDVGWYEENGGNTTHPVGTKKCNELKIYDMSGNVCEWCSDWFEYDYYSTSEQTNPTGPKTGSLRVVRGGGWGKAKDCLVFTRLYFPPFMNIKGFGARLALSSPLQE